jgi:hypothetical protein
MVARRTLVNTLGNPRGDGPLAWLTTLKRPWSLTPASLAFRVIFVLENDERTAPGKWSSRMHVIEPAQNQRRMLQDVGLSLERAEAEKGQGKPR